MPRRSAKGTNTVTASVAMRALRSSELALARRKATTRSASFSTATRPSSMTATSMRRMLAVWSLASLASMRELVRSRMLLSAMWLTEAAKRAGASPMSGVKASRPQPP